jgi:hypothetical protein
MPPFAKQSFIQNLHINQARKPLEQASLISSEIIPELKKRKKR